MKNNKNLFLKESAELISKLQDRFEQNMNRHKGMVWEPIQTKLNLPANKAKLWSLNEMEKTGGEPDVVGFDKTTGEYIFNDCAAESPNGRRSICSCIASYWF